MTDAIRGIRSGYGEVLFMMDGWAPNVRGRNYSVGVAGILRSALDLLGGRRGAA